MSRVEPDPGEDRTSPDNAGAGSASEAVGADDEGLRQQLRDVTGTAFRRVEASAPPSVSGRIRAFRERLRSRRSLDTAWRIGVFTLGVTLLVAGLIMFVIPGPGFATIILGLVVLGSEFTWATRALDPVKGAARRASAAAMDPRRRRRNLILGIGLGVLAGLVAWWYLATYGFTLAPVTDWVRGQFS